MPIIVTYYIVLTGKISMFAWDTPILIVETGRMPIVT